MCNFNNTFTQFNTLGSPVFYVHCTLGECELMNTAHWENMNTAHWENMHTGRTHTLFDAK